MAFVTQSVEAGQRGREAVLANVAAGQRPGEDVGSTSTWLSTADREALFEKAFRPCSAPMPAAAAPREDGTALSVLVAGRRSRLAVREKTCLGAVEGRARGGRRGSTPPPPLMYTDSRTTASREAPSTRMWRVALLLPALLAGPPPVKIASSLL